MPRKRTGQLLSLAEAAELAGWDRDTMAKTLHRHNEEVGKTLLINTGGTGKGARWWISRENLHRVLGIETLGTHERRIRQLEAEVSHLSEKKDEHEEAIDRTQKAFGGHERRLQKLEKKSAS
jgi:hypothetical protein